jgi:uncharacterized membrane protein YkoI
MSRFCLSAALLSCVSVPAAEVDVQVDVGPGGVDVNVAVSDDLSYIRTALDTAKVRLVDAVEIARREVGGQAIEADLEVRRGVPTFEVDLLAERGRKQVRVDGVSGRVLDVDHDDGDDEDRNLRPVRMSLQQAIERAFQEVSGRAYDAELEVHHHRPRFEINLMVGLQWVQVMIDAESGRITSVRRSSGPIAGWYFDRVAAGSLPPGWAPRQTHEGKAPALWEVVPDPAAVSGPQILRLVKTENSGSTYNLCVAERPRVRDVDLRVMVRPDSGKEDQGGGLVWRYRDENNYYICRLNPLESNYRVYKVVEGKRTQLASAELAAEAGKWYELRAVMTGPAITCYVDGKPLLEAQDATLAGPGSIGLWTKADAATSFDDLVLLAPSTRPTATPQK